MSQELPSKQWSELAMFSRERVLCFVYEPLEDGFDIPAQESSSARQIPVNRQVPLALNMVERREGSVAQFGSGQGLLGLARPRRPECAFFRYRSGQGLHSRALVIVLYADDVSSPR